MIQKYKSKSDVTVFRCRENVNKKYVSTHSSANKNSSGEKLNYLSSEEEQDVLRYFEVKLAEFCAKFKVHFIIILN